MTSTVASAIRPGLRDFRTTSGSPHTPSRFISSNFSSPGSTFRQEEDAIIIEVGPRFISAGFEGESGPQCVIPFTPKRREGDYRIHLPGYVRRQVQDLNDWGKDYELWRNDLQHIDLTLLEDKLERAVREAYNKHLLVDAGSARLILLLPSLLPHPVLSTILFLLFERWKFPTISLLSSPTTAVVAAGLRSALVVDIGWEETVITPIYEYCELRPWRSSRAMQFVTRNFGQLLMEVLDKQPEAMRSKLRFDFDFVEDVVGRIAHCSRLENDKMKIASMQAARTSPEGQGQPPGPIIIDWPTSDSFESIEISRDLISSTVESSLLDDTATPVPDDHELSLPDLLYRSLLNLSADVRSTLLPRIIFIGNSSEIPNLRAHILASVSDHITTHGWSGVRGKHYKSNVRTGLAEMAQGRATAAAFHHDVPLPIAEKDYAEEKVRKQKAKDVEKPANTSPLRKGVLGKVETLGSWSGASLMTTLKIRGVVEIEREKYLAHGLSGASRDAIAGVVVGQRNASADVQTRKGAEKAAWTLGIWA